jgi:hypothetical protein
MNAELSTFAARLRFPGAGPMQDHEFNELALELFALQFKYNPAYRKICEAHRVTPGTIEHSTQIPFVPTSAFKELDFSCIPPEERTTVFHSSGTTEQKPSRHSHCAESLKVYETSLWPWFQTNVIDSKNFELAILTPPPQSAPNSSLVHKYETVRQKLGAPEPVFLGKIDSEGAWILDFDKAVASLRNVRKPKLILGTAFSFVHLLDYLTERNLRFKLPEPSRVMETGGYKNRSRSMPRTELHLLMTELLRVPRENIICEYGMSELSSQAYDTSPERHFRFPSWARVQIISPETGGEVGDGEIGLTRIFDLANVFSVAAIQTEDLAVRHGNGFELIGRATLAEARGCSLMTA